MHPLFNLVGTNSQDGDHAFLQRWYADHVHLLFRFEGLHAATLFQRSDVHPGLTAESDATHYQCRYAFASPQAFEAFEVSAERANAPRLGRPDWMPTGLRIARRQQYRRVTYRANPSGAALLPGSPSRAPAHWQFQAFELEVAHASPAMDEAERWLQGCIHEATQAPGTVAVDLQRRTSAAPGRTEYLAMRAIDAADDASVPWDLPAAGRRDSFGPAPVASTTLWQASYRALAFWTR